MKQKLKAIFKGPVVFYPLLFAAFPILFLYAHNISETPVSQVWLPLWVSVAAALVLWMFLSAILRSLAKAGLATAIFLLFFFSYGRLYDALEAWGVFVPKDAYLLPTMLFIWGYCVYFISRAKREFRVSSKVLNIMSVALIAINLFNIAVYQVKPARVSADASVESTAQAGNSSAELSTPPDIYHIILDEYASLSTIEEYYGYDNSEFADRLTEEGFFVAHESRTHIASTEYSLGSLLNMEYIPDTVSLDMARERYEHNSVAEFLRSKGYSFVYIGMYDVDADLHYDYYELNENSNIANEFLRIAWDTTMLRPFYTYVLETRYENYHRAAVMDSIELLENLPEMPGPKFVFAHILCPHEPFVFDSSGGPVGAEDLQNYADKSVYLGQYIFITSEIEKVITAILEKSESPPIIILQSDHGPKTLGRDAAERIFNALYLPDNGSDYLYDSIAQVNTYRLIFNHYFGAHYPLLEDYQG
jgi:hypothetical protein